MEWHSISSKKDSLRGTKDCSRLYISDYSKKEVVSLGLYPQLSLFQRITAKDWQKVAAALESVQMADFAKRQIGELSGGQFQKSIDRSHITPRSGIHFFR